MLRNLWLFKVGSVTIASLSHSRGYKMLIYRRDKQKILQL